MAEEDVQIEYFAWGVNFLNEKQPGLLVCPNFIYSESDLFSENTASVK
jgi:hypothetical protein